MKKIIGILLLFFSQIPWLEAHQETVATLAVFHQEGKLYITATLDKKHLSLALMAEGECALKDMMNVCASKYMTTHIGLSVNGKKMTLQKQGIQLQRDVVIITYRVNEVANIQQMEIESDYMLAYNPHSITKYVVHLGEQTRYFSTKESLQKLSIKNPS